MTQAALGSFDRVAKVYDATRGIPPGPDAEVADALAAILREASDLPRVLEVGVGTGRIALPLAARDCHMVGVDIASAMLAELGRKGELALVRGSAQELPFATDAFDAVLFVHVLHLVPDPGAAVRAALRSARRGGRLVFANDDLPRESIWGAANKLVQQVAEEVCGLALRQHTRHVRAIEALMAELDAVGANTQQMPIAAWEQPFRGNDLLEQLGGRMMSWMWEIPEPRMPTVIEALRPRLEALCGGLDQVHAQPRSMSALVASLPA